MWLIDRILASGAGVLATNTTWSTFPAMTCLRGRAAARAAHRQPDQPVLVATSTCNPWTGS